jgi:hypothetical protein
VVGVAGRAVFVIGTQGGFKYHMLRTARAPAEPLRHSVVGCEPGELQHSVVAEYLAADVFDTFDVGEELLPQAEAVAGLVAFACAAVGLRVRT